MGGQGGLTGFWNMLGYHGQSTCRVLRYMYVLASTSLTVEACLLRLEPLLTRISLQELLCTSPERASLADDLPRFDFRGLPPPSYVRTLPCHRRYKK